MSLNFNKAIVAGRITADLELKKTNSGKSVVTFTIASNRDQNYTNFIRVVAWEKTAEFIAKYFKKASPILVEGEITTREYEDSNGNKRTATQVTARSAFFVESKASESTSPTETYEVIQNEDALPF